VYNCASGINVTVGELLEKVKKHFGRSDLSTKYYDWAVGDIKKFDVSNQKLRKLGFDFKWAFDDGLTKTLDWLAEHFEKSDRLF